MKFLIRSFIYLYYRILSFNFNKSILYEFDLITKKISNTVTRKKNSLEFININKLTNYRINTFYTKEPKTIEWIDNFNQNSIFWDIGSNVGSYSIYASKFKNCKTFAFEPSVFNLELLARNINLNNLEKFITIISVPLTISNSIDFFSMTDTTNGGALSSFAYDYDQNGNALKSIFKYKTIGSNPYDLLKFYNLDPPEYIKIDVDGAELLIVEGFHKEFLINTKEILIEINDGVKGQYEKINHILINFGFKLESKYYFDDTLQFNGIWKKI